MEKRMLLSCPDNHLQKNERIIFLANTIAGWIHSEAFCRLMALFGGVLPVTESTKGQIGYCNTFADIWDYRKHTANGGERWLVTEDQFLSDHTTEIMECMFLLGLTGVTKPTQQPDYVLPLGGARMANLDRCLAAEEVCRLFPQKMIPVIALTGMRPINEIEQASLEKYAPESKTEYEAVCGGIEKAFDLRGVPFTEDVYTNENVNLAWAERRYSCEQRMIHVLSAPSTAPTRRANSVDTFESFLKRYNPKPGSNILLITSQIYVPFQLMKFMKYALEHDFYVECIGNTPYDHSPTVLNVASYLQELKATINAIHALAEVYF